MKGLRAFLMDLGLVACSIAATALLLGVVLTVAGYPAHRILIQWVAGAIGPADLLSALKGACPLILTGLAAGIAFRSGVFNIGGEGQSSLGSIFAVTLATRIWPGASTAWLAIPSALLVAALGGALWALVPAVLDRLRGVPVVLSTILLTFIA